MKNLGEFDEAIRSRMRKAYEESPPSLGFRPIVVLWRFPHLEPINHAWVFMSSMKSTDGLLRIAKWDRFNDLNSVELNPIEITDVSISPDDLIEAWEVLGRIEIIADQTGGIYDGARYGRDLYNDSTGDIEDTIDWNHGNTFGALENLLSAELRDKMNWSSIPYEDDVLNRTRC